MSAFFYEFIYHQTSIEPSKLSSILIHIHCPSYTACLLSYSIQSQDYTTPLRHTIPNHPHHHYPTTETTYIHNVPQTQRSLRHLLFPQLHHRRSHSNLSLWLSTSPTIRLLRPETRPPTSSTRSRSFNPSATNQRAALGQQPFFRQDQENHKHNHLHLFFFIFFVVEVG